jgi:TRAP-type C4-dicarboxylate transport system permease small subunit
VRRLSDGLNQAAEVVSSALLGALVSVLAFGVASRFVLHAPLAWSDELSRYLLVWISFLGSSVAFRRGMHLGVEVWTGRLRAGWRRLLGCFVAVVVLVLMSVIAVEGVKLALFNTAQRSPAMRIPMVGPYLAVPVGAVLVAIHALAELVDLAGLGDQRR